MTTEEFSRLCAALRISAVDLSVWFGFHRNHANKVQRGERPVAPRVAAFLREAARVMGPVIQRHATPKGKLPGF